MERLMQASTKDMAYYMQCGGANWLSNKKLEAGGQGGNP